MKKSEFEKIEKEYNENRRRLESIAIGDLVWEAVPRYGDVDYHAAIVKKVNVDENYIEVIDVSDENQEKKYRVFLTESELMELERISEETIKKEYKKYEGIIKTLVA